MKYMQNNFGTWWQQFDLTTASIVRISGFPCMKKKIYEYQ